MTENQNHTPLSPEDFVKAWQTSLSIDDVAEKVGLSKNAVTTRVRAYRKRGVKLKALQGRRRRRPPQSYRPVDVDALNRLIESLAGADDAQRVPCPGALEEG